MFGIDKDGIRKCFGDFNAKILTLPQSPDPVVQALVNFVQALGKMFN